MLKKGVYTMIFLSIILIGIGLTMFFQTDVFWEITESWKSHSSSGPSDFYKFEVKFGGVMFFLVGLGNLIVVLFF